MTDAPTARYLAGLVRAFLSDGAVPPPPRLVNVDRLVDLIVTHRLAACLGPLLDIHTLPVISAANLSRARRDQEVRTIILLLELERIVPALEAAGIKPVVLKGAALAVDIYARPEKRWFVDLDILVPIQQRSAALATLAELGYRHPAAGLHPDYYDRYHFHRILFGPRRVCLELHWGITVPDSVYRYDLDELRAGARSVALGRGTMRIPGAVDQLLHGVLQNIFAGFRDLRRIVDAGLLVARLTDEERNAMVVRARRNRLGVGLWLLYRTVEEIAGFPVPDEVAGLAPDGEERRALEAIPFAENCLLADEPLPSGYVSLVHWLCTPSRKLRWRELHRYVWPTTAGLMELGHGPDALPGLPSRLRHMLGQLKSLALLGRAVLRWRREAG